MIVAMIAAALMQSAASPERLSDVELTRRYEARVAEAAKRLSRAGPSESVAGELARREAMYQARSAALEEEVLAHSAQRFMPQAVVDSVKAADAADVSYLRSVIPADGWFRKSRDGASTASNAWILLQHTGDAELMAEIARRIEPLVQRGEVDGRDFAFLYDRGEVYQNRRQRFGTQFACIDGKMGLYPIIDPLGVDGRRKALGMETVGQDAARMRNLGAPCPRSVPAPTN